MKYRGRIISIFFVISILLFIREAVKRHFGETPHLMPLPALLPILLAWYLGKQYDKYVYLSTKDTLTGLFNRRFVTDNFPKIIKKADRNRLKVAILILDVNSFKEINDTYGHDYGDQVLEGISKVLSNSFGKNDVIARWGGDEFLIISPFSNENLVLDKINSFNSNIEKGSSLLFPAGFSVSIGMSVYPSDASSLKELVSNADLNMYEIKMDHKQRQVSKV